MWRENNWWIVQCLDVDVATQGGSESEAMENLAEALELHFDTPCNSAILVHLRQPAHGYEIELEIAASFAKYPQLSDSNNSRIPNPVQNPAKEGEGL